MNDNVMVNDNLAIKYNLTTNDNLAINDNLNINDKIISLNNLPLGKKATVKELTSEGTIRRRMLDLGLVSDTEIEALQRSPSGDPIAYYIRGAVIALRSEEARKIIVEALL